MSLLPLVQPSQTKLGETEEEATTEPDNRSDSSAVLEEAPGTQPDRKGTHRPVHQPEIQGSQTAGVSQTRHVIQLFFNN